MSVRRYGVQTLKIMDYERYMEMALKEAEKALAAGEFPVEKYPAGDLTTSGFHVPGPTRRTRCTRRSSEPLR